MSKAWDEFEERVAALRVEGSWPPLWGPGLDVDENDLVLFYATALFHGAAMSGAGMIVSGSDVEAALDGTSSRQREHRECRSRSTTRERPRVGRELNRRRAGTRRAHDARLRSDPKPLVR
jgi:hypothetical protein